MGAADDKEPLDPCTESAGTPLEAAPFRLCLLLAVERSAALTKEMEKYIQTNRKEALTWEKLVKGLLQGRQKKKKTI